ncbi:MAG: hypothetical protein KDD76_06545, partial [Rickettsiales bacterium]|nr:hypothetical protein [Rickettsiales bacterium]
MADARFFHNTGPYTLGELAEKAGLKLHDSADSSKTVSDVAPLHTAGPEHLSFLDNIKYAAAFSQSNAGACILHPKFIARAPKGTALLI